MGDGHVVVLKLGAKIAVRLHPQVEFERKVRSAHISTATHSQSPSPLRVT
jgi:hypothetical protein